MARPLALVAALLALAAAVAAVAAPAAADAHEPVVRWSGEVVLDAPFVVAEGTTLVVEPGTLVRPASFRHENRDDPAMITGTDGYLVVRGRLLALGTDAAPVTFRTNVTLLGAGADGSVVEHAVFDAAATPFPCALASFEARFRVESSTFSNNTWTLCVNGGEARIVGNVFRLNGFTERHFTTPPCVEEETDGHEISTSCPPEGYMTRGEPGAADRCWATWQGRELCRGAGGVDRAVTVEWGRAVVEGNRFESNEGGVYVHRNASAVVSGNVFVDNGVGVTVLASPGLYGPPPPADRVVVVEDNRFERHGDPHLPHAGPLGPTGLRVGGRVGDVPDAPVGDVRIRNNTFANGTIGVHLGGDARGVRFEGNLFLGNGVGLSNEYGTATVEGGRFESVQWDLMLWGGPGRLTLVGVEFDPEKVKIHGDGVVAHDGGVIRNLTLAVVIGSAGAFLLALLTEAGRWLLARGALPAYARLTRAELLANPVRGRLLARVRDEPGLHLRALARDAGSYGAAVYHLDRLEREGLVRSARDGARRRFYPSGAAPADTPLAPLARRLLALVEERPGIRVGEAARALACSRQLASHHARALAERGLVEVGDAPGGARVLRPVGETADRSRANRPEA